MLKNISAPALLNVGSLATFAAFPLLYRAAFGGSSGMLFAGLALTACGMIAPFIALRNQTSAVEKHS